MRGVFWCPADTLSKEGPYDSTSYAYSMAFYHSPEQVNLITTIDQQYKIDPAPLAIPQKPGRVMYPSQKILAGEWYSVHEPIRGKDGGWWTKAGRRVFLFADLHVAALDWKEIIPGNDGFPNPNVTVNGIRGRDVR